MNCKILFTPSAEEDLQNAFTWYENESPGLGWEFRNEIALCTEKITNHTVSYQIYIGEIHKIAVARFPYIIYYRTNDLKEEIL